MDNVRYSAKRLAEIVGATPKQVEGALGKKDGFAPDDLPVLREKLRRPPDPFPPRVQLFLNFKGGTGKTSLSSSYAYRLAERGYRVLMIDLDSQGHATKCLGQEGGTAERTLHDVLIRKMPLDEVTIETAHARARARPGQPRHEHDRPRAHAARRSRVSRCGTRSRASRRATTSW